ncbi:hypothetical protein ACFE04_016170 [Oxalis oulophora]
MDSPPPKTTTTKAPTTTTTTTSTAILSRCQSVQCSMFINLVFINVEYIVIRPGIGFCSASFRIFVQFVGGDRTESSPFTNFADKLSPIEPVKARSTVQGLFRLNSPLQFISPRIQTLHHSEVLKRPEDPISSNEETPRHESHDNIMNNNSDVADDIDTSGSKLGTHGQLINDILVDDAKNLEQVQHGNSSGCVDKYLALADHLEMDSTNSAYSSCKKLEVTKYVGAQSSLNCSTGLKKFTLKSISQPERMHDQEVSQNQRGPSRRCLQFEESQPKAATNTSRSSSLADNESADFESLNSSHLDLSSTAKNRKLLNLSRHMAPPPKPLGIGLHLNSVFTTAAVGHNEKANMKLPKGHITVHQINTVPNIAFHSQNKPITPTCSSPSDSFQDMENATLQNKRVFSNLESTDFIEESDHHSPQKKRMKSSSTNDGDGCKRCNCKKTKCLKLYCDCFAAGVYCDGPCACKGCFNKPEYRDLIEEAKQQIESRNPTAFAPKIVQLAPASEERINLYTPSARHKRGCNCKKSECLKKYCECYQSKVGCSIGCRCEGCKNVHGKREEYVATMLNDSISESSHGKNASKSLFISRRHLRTTDSDNSKTLETNKEALDGGSYSQKTDDHILDMEQFLPRFAGIPSPATMALGSSVSSKNKSCKSGSLIQLGPGSCRLSSGGSLRWRSSPVTPLTQLIETKTLESLESDSALSNILEDESPEMFKGTSTPIKSVKVSSPNRKRVSLPQILGSSTSGSLKSSGRYTLKAVAFPPLTPCVGSKDNELQEKISDE